MAGSFDGTNSDDCRLSNRFSFVDGQFHLRKGLKRLCNVFGQMQSPTHPKES